MIRPELLFDDLIKKSSPPWTVLFMLDSPTGQVPGAGAAWQRTRRQTAAILYDPYTGFLFTGDTVYQGACAWRTVLPSVATIARFAAFCETYAVTHVLGCRIEVTAEAGVDYPIRTTLVDSKVQRLHQQQPVWGCHGRRPLRWQAVTSGLMSRSGFRRTDDEVGEGVAPRRIADLVNGVAEVVQLAHRHP